MKNKINDDRIIKELDKKIEEIEKELENYGISEVYWLLATIILLFLTVGLLVIVLYNYIFGG